MLRLAWQFLRFDRAKTIGALVGTVVSVFLLGQQTGVFQFLTTGMQALVANSRGELWVVDARTENANQMGTLDLRKLREVQAVEGVATATEMVIASGAARFPNGESAGVQLIGSRAPDFPGGPDPKWFALGGHKGMMEENGLSYDYYDRKILGDAELGMVFEINGRRAIMTSQTQGVRGFGAVYLFTTLERARYYGNVPIDRLSSILVTPAPGTDPAQLRDRINRQVPGVRAWLKKDFAAATVATVLGSTGIAISVGTLVMFAVISGTFIIGLTLYSAAIDRIRDYGTLKAIGARNGFVTRLIVLQALFFAFLGYVLGTVLLEGFLSGVAQSGVIFDFKLWVRVAIFIITVLISLGGSWFAIRRIVRVEPASVFRG